MKKSKQGVVIGEAGFLKALVKGDIFTKLSLLVPGLGNIRRGQVIKGILFLCIAAAYWIYFFGTGLAVLEKLPTLGTKTQEKVWDEAQGIFVYEAGDNSLLILLSGVIFVFLTAAFLVFWRAVVRSAYRAEELARAGRHVPDFREEIESHLNGRLHRTLLCLPVLGVLVFTVLPLVFMMSMAFTNYDREHQVPGKLFTWVGLDNFRTVLDFDGAFGRTFWPILGWTFTWAIFATFLNYILGMLLAILINSKPVRWKGFWRFCFILSIAVPQFVTLLTMRTLLQPNGATNVLLREWGLIAPDAALPFFTNATWARVTIILVNIWVGVPYTLLTTTGILQNIPAELYEAARVDGANARVTFFKITLPYMLFVTAPTLITTFITNINNFNVIYLLSGGAPATMEYYRGTAGKTDLLVTWLYKLTIDNKDYCYGAVIGILTFVISIVISLAAYRRTAAYKNEEGFQ
ncbi:MAG: sugar ABC transporter permease [Lachnospiraceae bacterium]|nr:sugar ABC transporter permease [Lachnospiraceae bacterium]